MTVLAEIVDVVIGVDTRRHTHTAVVLAAATTAVAENTTATADGDGERALLETADRHGGLLQAWGIPAEVEDRIKGIQDHTPADASPAVCSYAGAPDDEAGPNVCPFLREVLPELQRRPHPYRRLGVPDDQPSEAALAKIAASSWVPAGDTWTPAPVART